MKHKTGITWTHVPGTKGETWNPVTGCTKVSPGCAFCYAEQWAAKRLADHPRYQGVTKLLRSGEGCWTGLVRVHHDMVRDPLRWQRPRTVFVCSMADLFHPAVTLAFLEALWHVFQQTPQHTYQILTKRPENMLRFVRWFIGVHFGHGPDGEAEYKRAFRHVWHGTTTEDNHALRERARILQQIPAEVNWLSIEPMLTYLPDLDNVLATAEHEGHPINWLVFGHESGTKARPGKLRWVQDGLRVAREHQIAAFVKQLQVPKFGPRNADGASPVSMKLSKNPEEWPTDLQVRQFPFNVVPNAEAGRAE